MANAIDLITAANVKSMLNISSVTHDTFIGALITQCSQWLYDFCGRQFIDSAERTEFLDGGGETIKVKCFPIGSITSISYRSGDYDNPTWTAYDGATEYVVNEATGQIHFVFRLPAGYQNIRVVYTGGYSDESGGTPIPYALKLACEKLVVKEFLRRKSQGSLSEGISDARVQWKEEMDEAVRSLLAPYISYEL